MRDPAIWAGLFVMLWLVCGVAYLFTSLISNKEWGGLIGVLVQFGGAVGLLIWQGHKEKEKIR